MHRLTLLLALAILAACATDMQRRRRLSALALTADQFAQALRWQRFALCERALAPEVKDVFRRKYVERTEVLRLTDVEISGVDVAEDGSSATVRARARWVLLPSITEQVSTLEQRWEDRAKGWVLTRMLVAEGTGDGPLDVQ